MKQLRNLVKDEVFMKVSGSEYDQIDEKVSFSCHEIFNTVHATPTNLVLNQTRSKLDDIFEIMEVIEDLEMKGYKIAKN